MYSDETYRLLPGIHGPDDVKALPEEELPLLAEELRRRIMQVVSRNGGHLASSLGVVELTIALHRVFSSPDDKIIWDVGHQCYAHKLLTGRNDAFDTLRTEGGVSGFPKRSESPHDAFDTGHAGTSISAALGMARARDHLGKEHRVVAVIGDGSMTAGMAFEGLNHAGALHTNLTVVLNDNKMSISHNVGALSQYLNRVITGKWYTRLREEIDPIVESIVGDHVASFAKRMEEGIKGAIVPGRLFEDLGFKYYGPIEGHELPYLLETFERVKGIRGPKLVHVVTTKGKGYARAEEEAHSFHGVSPFHPATGAARKARTVPSYTEVFADTLVELGEKDDRIVAITAAMPEGTGLARFAETFPDRTYDVGIAEQHAVTFAAGMAAEGMKPVVAIYSTFLQRVFDQIVHDVALMKLDVTFAVDRAGIVGEDGATHQGLFDLTFLRCIPDLMVMAPADENELRRMLATAVAHPGPAAIRYPRGSAVGVACDAVAEPLPVGKAAVVREGADVAIIAIGSMVGPAMAAATLLADEGIDAAVINARFVKPLDCETIAAFGRRCGLLVTVEENVLAGGFGSAVLEAVEAEGLPHVAVRRIGVADAFVEQATQASARRRFGLDPEGIAATTRAFVAARADLRHGQADASKKAVGSAPR
jgi:1-deoxy-D-xylulose-5-phosphate synthase